MNIHRWRKLEVRDLENNSYKVCLHFAGAVRIVPQRKKLFFFIFLLQGSDPSTYEMIQKIQTLQRRLIQKTEEVNDF